MSGMSKDELRAENRRLTREVQNVRNDYAEIEVIIQELDKEYERSKSGFPLTRYNKLKKMIKDSTTESAMEKAKIYASKSKSTTSSREPQHKSGGVSKLMQSCRSFADGGDEASKGPDPVEQKSGKGGFSSLVNKCKVFAGVGDEKSFASQDSSNLTKQELIANNEEKRKELDRFHSKFLRAYNRLDKLKREYEQSKEHNFITRHTKLKSMIKDVTYDKQLKTD